MALLVGNNAKLCLAQLELGLGDELDKKFIRTNIHVMILTCQGLSTKPRIEIWAKKGQQ